MAVTHWTTSVIHLQIELTASFLADVEENAVRDGESGGWVDTPQCRGLLFALLCRLWGSHRGRNGSERDRQRGFAGEDGLYRLREPIESDIPDDDDSLLRIISCQLLAAGLDEGGCSVLNVQRPTREDIMDRKRIGSGYQ